MAFISTMVTLVCLCIGVVFYTLWDIAVVLLFIPRFVFELVMLFIALLIAAADRSFLCSSDSADHTLMGVAKFESRHTLGILRRDLIATLTIHRYFKELEQ